MVGGGRGAFIGGVHRMAMRLDGRIDLVAGAFSSNPEKSKLSGEDLFLDPRRVYADYRVMAAEEARLPEGERIDFVSVVTPNRAHVPVSRTFLEAGFNVVCDKPLAFTLEEALDFREVVRKSGKVFVLTHNYTGYPMVKQARELVRSGELGEILKIVAEYPQGWLGKPIDAEGQKQASWRTNPEEAGASSCLGDIGTHAENLARYITGLEIDELCAEFTTFVEGRKLEDDANLLIRYKGGAKGVLYASQISAGEENSLRVRVYGSRASLEWYQEDPNRLFVKYPDAPRRVYRAGNEYLSDSAKRFGRIPAGHPEAFLEAFANIYLEAARAIEAVLDGQPVPPDSDFPTVDSGVEGMAFIATAVKSAKAGGVWTKMVAV
ncbi:MAG TPA: Gfo/Idh/MocA family oxidoreductase [Terrimicrobiaceae bacterium]|nr:Gfo/Idh/MocA family oxidoreductase [Terrimicrobiaceae bacterium]